MSFVSTILSAGASAGKARCLALHTSPRVPDDHVADGLVERYGAAELLATDLPVKFVRVTKSPLRRGPPSRRSAVRACPALLRIEWIHLVGKFARDRV